MLTLNIANDQQKQPKVRRKYAAIKKAYVSVENAEEEERKHAKDVVERAKNISLIKTLKVETPWTTGSSDEGSQNYLYYKIQQAKKLKYSDPKYERIFMYLNEMKIEQIDFHGMIKETSHNKECNALYQKALVLSQDSQKSSKLSSLFMRRKLEIDN